jgi:fructokinase
VGQGAGPWPTAAAAATLLAARPGGGPANTAVGLARLGTPTALLARIGDDAFGRMIRAHLAGSGVDLRFAVTAAEPTTLAVASLDGAGVAAYTFYVAGCADGAWSAADLPAALPADCTAVHAGGALALAVPAFGDVVEELLAREHGSRVLSVDPNVRPALVTDPAATRARWRRWLQRATVVKASVDDAGWLEPDAATPDRTGVAATAAGWSAAGPALVVVTRGGAGLYARTGRHEVWLDAEPVPVADTVGAGDALTAGLLDWLARRDLLTPDRLADLDRDALTAAARFAAHVAARCCTRPGADPPWRHELTGGSGCRVSVSGRNPDRSH